MLDFPHGCHGFKVVLNGSDWTRRVAACSDRIRVGDTIKNTDKQTGTRNRNMYNRIQKEKDLE